VSGAANASLPVNLLITLKESKVVKRLIILLLMCALIGVSSVMGYSMSEMKVIRQRVELIEQNTEIIKSISGVAMTQSAVSDLLIRLSHYTDKHKDGKHMCPECSGATFEFDEDIEDVDVELEESHEQVMSDLREIESSIDSLTFGHLHQIQKMERMLEKERKKSELDNVDFFGGGVL
jgi:hypothetical protein